MDALPSTNDGLLSWPGGTPDIIEFGRGVLAALTYVSNDQAREVHILRLRNALHKAGLAHSLRYVLNVLTLMRELQELKGGYWFPTPVRLVPLDRTALVIAPIATAELGRHFPVSRAGYARWLSVAGEIDLPKQSLDDWAGFEIFDTALWTREVLRQGIASMGPTIQSESLEFFGLEQIVTGSGKSTRVRWVREARAAILGENKIALCRSRLGEDYYRYFLGYVEKGRLVRETSVPRDIDRLQHGIAYIVGRPLTVEIANDDTASILRIFSAVPRPERRLLLALANRTSSARGKAFRVEVEEHLVLITRVLKNLGCEARHANAR